MSSSKNQGSSRQRRRAAERRAKKSGFAPGVTFANYRAFDRFAEGKGRGSDFKLAAEIFKASGEMLPEVQGMSATELGQIFQIADRLITEGVVRVVLPDEDLGGLQ